MALVRGTVRNPDRKADGRYLTDLPGAAERLELVAGQDTIDDRRRRRLPAA
jgi:hypothetical protein